MSHSKFSTVVLVLAAHLVACGGSGGSGSGGGAAGGGSGSGGGAGGGSSTGTIEIVAPIESATTWSKQMGTDCDYLIPSGETLNVRADLTVSAGTKVCFAANSGLNVEPTGSLNAVGTIEKPIVFTGTSATRGFWTSINVESNNSKNVLAYVTVSFGGGSGASASFILGDGRNSASASFSNSTFADSLSTGLSIEDKAQLSTFSTNSFFANGLGSVMVGFQEASGLDSQSNYSGGARPNQFKGIRVRFQSGSSTVPVTLRKLDVPWAMSVSTSGKTQEVDSTLTVEAGARVEFEAATGIIVSPSGKLVANGTAADQVVFTGLNAVPGFWKGIALKSLGNELTSTQITYAGNAAALCCGFFDNKGDALAGLVLGDISATASVTVRDVTITKSLNWGYYALNRSTITKLGTNDFTGNPKGNVE